MHRKVELGFRVFFLAFVQRKNMNWPPDNPECHDSIFQEVYEILNREIFYIPDIAKLCRDYYDPRCVGCLDYETSLWPIHLHRRPGFIVSISCGKYRNRFKGRRFQILVYHGVFDATSHWSLVESTSSNQYVSNPETLPWIQKSLDSLIPLNPAPHQPGCIVWDDEDLSGRDLPHEFKQSLWFVNHPIPMWTRCIAPDYRDIKRTSYFYHHSFFERCGWRHDNDVYWNQALMTQDEFYSFSRSKISNAIYPWSIRRNTMNYESYEGPDIEKKLDTGHRVVFLGTKPELEAYLNALPFVWQYKIGKGIDVTVKLRRPHHPRHGQKVPLDKQLGYNSQEDSDDSEF
jgi:hypothetical protein